MTFQPVIPPVALIVVAVVLVSLRLITMRRLHLAAGSRWATVWRWCGLTLAVLLVLIAAARPGIERGDEQAAAAARSDVNTNVFFLVDRSADSLIEDYVDGQPRMSGIRTDIDALIDRHPQARFAMIEFASRSSLDRPLSDDAWSLEPVVGGLYPYATQTSDLVNAGAAANVLRYQLIAAGQQYPRSESLVYYFGSGAGGSRAPQGEFDLAPGMVDGGAVYGYGTAVNEPGLLRIAAQLGVPYVHRQAGQPVAETVPDRGAPADASQTSASGVSQRTELYWVFTLLAAVLLLFELFATVREFRRTRMARRDMAL